MMNLAMAFERTDEVVLPAVYSFVAASFGANLLQLSYLTLARALTQALLSPLGGWLGHAFNRVAVLSAGCLVWGLAMAAFAFSTTLGQGVACWALTGAGLCIVVPNAQSLTADLHEEARRGAAFGTLHLTSALGAALGGLYATNVGAARPLGWDGWRVAMALLGVAALGIGALNAVVSADPRALRGSRWRLAPEGEGEGGEGEEAVAAARRVGARGGDAEGGLLLGGGGGRGALLLGGGASAAAFAAAAAAAEEAVALTAASAFDDDDEGAFPPSAAAAAVAPKRPAVAAPPPAPPSFLSDFAAVLRVPTFGIIVAQGIVGNVPMAALAFQTLYLQLLGVPAAWASAAVSAGFGAHALGGLVGGALGDAAARWSPRHGRVLVCQASVVLGALATLLMLRGLPRGYSSGAPSGALPPPPLPPPPPPPEARSRAAAAVPSYLAVFVLGGLVNAWPAPACNNPIFAEIVPARSRTLVYAFDRSFEMVRTRFFYVLFRARSTERGWVREVSVSSTHPPPLFPFAPSPPKTSLGRRRPRRWTPRLPRRHEALRLRRRRGRRQRRPGRRRPQGRGALRGARRLDRRSMGPVRPALQRRPLHLREGQGARGREAGDGEAAAAGERRRSRRRGRLLWRGRRRSRRCFSKRQQRHRRLPPLPAAAAPEVGLDRREARGLRHGGGRGCSCERGRGRRGRVVAAERRREEEKRRRQQRRWRRRRWRWAMIFQSRRRFLSPTLFSFLFLKFKCSLNEMFQPPETRRRRMNERKRKKRGGKGGCTWSGKERR